MVHPIFPIHSNIDTLSRADIKAFLFPQYQMIIEYLQKTFPPDKAFTIKEFALLFKVSYSMIRSLIYKGRENIWSKRTVHLMAHITRSHHEFNTMDMINFLRLSSEKKPTKWVNNDLYSVKGSGLARCRLAAVYKDDLDCFVGLQFPGDGSTIVKKFPPGVYDVRPMGDILKKTIAGCSEFRRLLNGPFTRVDSSGTSLLDAG